MTDDAYLNNFVQLSSASVAGANRVHNTYPLQPSSCTVTVLLSLSFHLCSHFVNDSCQVVSCSACLRRRESCRLSAGTLTSFDFSNTMLFQTAWTWKRGKTHTHQEVLTSLYKYGVDVTLGMLKSNGR